MFKWIMTIIVACACILGLGVLFQKAATHKGEVQQTAAEAKIPEAPLDANAAQALYKQSCMSCHGTDLQGGVGPNLQKIGGKLSAEQIYKQIENGSGVMPAFKSQLKNETVANLARWLAEKK